MTRYRPLILSLAAPEGEGPPPLCRLLALCGIPSRRLEPGQSRETRRVLAPLLARAGILDLIWAGLPLMILHLVVPGGLALGPAVDGADDGDLLDADAAEVGDGWQDATAFWYPLP